MSHSYALRAGRVAGRLYGLETFHLRFKLSSRRVDRPVDPRTDQLTDIGGPRYPRQALVEDASGDSFGHMQRGVEDSLVGRVDEICGEIFLADLFGNGPRGDEKHFVGDSLCLSGKECHRHGWEDVDVVALVRDEFPAADIDRGKRAAAGKNGSTAGPAIGFLGRAFGARGRIGIWKDDRPRTLSISRKILVSFRRAI
jgi:hypothetical protein